MMAAYEERGPFGPQPGGDVGGDDTTTDSWCRRFARLMDDGQYAVCTVYFYLWQEGSFDDEPTGPLSLMRETEFEVWRDPDDSDSYTYQSTHQRYETVRTGAELTEEDAVLECAAVSSDEFDWDGFPGAEQDCRVDQLISHSDGSFIVTCRSHGSLSSVRDPADGNRLATNFRCDRGREWRFLVRQEHDSLPMLVDLTGLNVQVSGHVQFSSLNESGDLVVRRWVDDDTLVPMALSYVPGSGKPAVDAQAGTVARFPRYQLLDADGACYLDVTVPSYGDA